MITYRTAQPAEAEVLAQLHTKSWQSAYRGILSDDYLENKLLPDRQKIWHERMNQTLANRYVCIAYQNDTPVGFVCVYGNEDERLGSLVDNLHVLPGLKGQGIGAKLLQQAAAWAHEYYPDMGLHLWVYEANEAARGFYEKMGGQYVESTLHHNPDGGQASVYCYAWPSLMELLDAEMK